MSDREPDEPGGQDRPQLAGLLTDRLIFLSQVRPLGARATEHEHRLAYAFDWPYLPADELLIVNGRAGAVAELRAGFLRVVGPELSDLVASELGRAVPSALAEVTDDPCHAGISFLLSDGRAERTGGTRAVSRRGVLDATDIYMAHLGRLEALPFRVRRLRPRR